MTTPDVDPIDAHIQKLVDEAPPLTADTLAELAGIIRPHRRREEPAPRPHPRGARGMTAQRPASAALAS